MHLTDLLDAIGIKLGVLIAGLPGMRRSCRSVSHNAAPALPVQHQLAAARRPNCHDERRSLPDRRERDVDF